jgi:DNA sulfur modification protein DndB
MSSYLARRSVQGFDDRPIVYYSVSMPVVKLMKDINLSTESNIKAPDGRKSDILSALLNRTVDKKRAYPIAKYLLTDDERFIPTIIVACAGGNPKFTTLKLDLEDPTTKGIAEFDNDIIEEDLKNIGVLSLSRDQKYFVLDGQHRLLGMSYVHENPRATDQFGLDQAKLREWSEGREDLLNDEVNVIFIENIIKDNENLDYESFIKRTRKLFTVLNKHQKATSKATNIALDEEDLAAVITRRLIEKEDTVGGLFFWDGLDEKSMNVDIQGSGALRAQSHYLTSLVTLHQINKAIIKILFDWSNDDFDSLDKSSEKDKRDMLNYDNEHITEVVLNIWDILVANIPDWKTKDPAKMKNHIKIEDRETGIEDNMLFWPIGQIGIAKYISEKTKQNSHSKYEYSKADMKKAAKSINTIGFDLFDAPWKGYLLHEKPDVDSLIKSKRTGEQVETKWSIRTKDDDRVLDTLRFLGSDNYSESKMTAVWKDKWSSELKLYEISEEEVKKMWDRVLLQRKKFTAAKK